MPTTIFKKKLANGECVDRDWLVWCKERVALFCLPYKIFSPHMTKLSILASEEGWLQHVIKSCYFHWKTEQLKHQKEKSLSDLMAKTIKHEQEVLRDLLRRLFDVTLFLAERGLAFRGDSDKIGDYNNGNFLSILNKLTAEPFLL